ncbi:putative ABC transporter [Trypanosoma vivax]|nr:putative ABC transporter [Trypanosoma vivax]
MVAGAAATCYVSVDYVTASSLTRSVRALATAARVIYMYKSVTPTSIEEQKNLHQAAAEMVLNLCLRNEGLYIKLGQGLTALNHVLPREYMNVLRVLLDNAPTVPMEEVQRIILSETGKTVDELFLHFDPMPVASASIAQVHRALLRPSNSQETPVEVAVKVQKPNIRRQVFWDLETYRLVSWMIGSLFNLPVAWARQTVIDGIRCEVDFSIEARNASRVREDFAGQSNIYVPRIYESLATPRLLVMEWIEATKIIEVETVRQQFDETAVLRILFDCFGDMIFKNGFVHCDPHGANVLVRPSPCKGTSRQRDGKPVGKCRDPQIVLLDFGLCCPESLRFRMEYALLVKSLVVHDITTAAKVTEAWGIADTETFATVQLQKPYRSFLRGNYSEATRDEISEMQSQAHARARTILAHQEQVPKELSLVGRSIDILRSINRLYGVPLNQVGMFVRRAVASLGSLNSFEDVQLYLKRVEELSTMGMEPNTESCSSCAAVPSHSLPPLPMRETLSPFNPVATIRKKAEEITELNLDAMCNTSSYERVRRSFFSLVRRVQFELALFILDAYYMLVRIQRNYLNALLHTVMLKNHIVGLRFRRFSGELSEARSGMT